MTDFPRMLNPLRALLQTTALDERRCILCHIPFSPRQTGSAAAEAIPLCPACRALLRPHAQHCTGRGAFSGTGTAGRETPPWQHFRFYGFYGSALKTLILRGKFGADIDILHLLGRLLARKCEDLPRPDAIVPIPLHPTRLRERGFNQSQILARPIAALLGVPLKPQLLHRRIPTRHQVGLSEAERMENLKDAFCAAPETRGRRILLIDDTCTTGTTLRRAAETLLTQGRAAAVDVAVVAWTQRYTPYYPDFPEAASGNADTTPIAEALHV